MRRLVVIALVFLAANLCAQAPPATTPDASNRANLTIALEPVGDTSRSRRSRHVSIRDSLRLPPGFRSDPGIDHEGGEVVRNCFVFPSARSACLLRTTQSFPEGETEIEARLLVPLEEQAPVILGKVTKKFTIAKTNKA